MSNTMIASVVLSNPNRDSLVHEEVVEKLRKNLDHGNFRVASMEEFTQEIGIHVVLDVEVPGAVTEKIEYTAKFIDGEVHVKMEGSDVAISELRTFASEFIAELVYIEDPESFPFYDEASFIAAAFDQILLHSGMISEESE